jgi:hypothetical protein
MQAEEAVKIIKSIPEGVEKFRFDICSDMTLNRVTRMHHYVIAKHKKDFTLLAQLDCQNRHKFNGKVWIEIFYFLKKNIDPIDNLPAALKPILDGMVKAGVIKGDDIGIIQSPLVSWHIKIAPKKNQKICDFVVILVSEKPIFKGCYINI